MPAAPQVPAAPPQHDPARVLAGKWLSGVQSMNVFKPEAFQDVRLKDGLTDFFNSRTTGMAAGFEADPNVINKLFADYHAELFDYLSNEFKELFV